MDKFTLQHDVFRYTATIKQVIELLRKETDKKKKEFYFDLIDQRAENINQTITNLVNSSFGEDRKSETSGSTVLPKLLDALLEVENYFDANGMQDSVIAISIKKVIKEAQNEN